MSAGPRKYSLSDDGMVMVQDCVSVNIWTMKRKCFVFDRVAMNGTVWQTRKGKTMASTLENDGH